MGTKKALREEQIELLAVCQHESTLVKLLSILGRSDRTKLRKNVLMPLIQDGLIEMTIPDTPRSQHQRYRTTPAGTDMLREYHKGMGSQAPTKEEK